MAMQNTPLVSIVIPVYNGSNYLRQAIDSALAQTYPNIEIIVVNDGSRDDGATERIAQSYGDRIRYFRKENGGVSTALNFGIQQMQGEYFSWLSHDDMYTPEKIAVQLSAADPNTVVLCGRRLVDAEGNPLQDPRQRLRFSESCHLSWQDAFSALMKQGCFNGCALLIPKQALISCGGFDTEMRYCQDLHLWMRLFLTGYGLSFVPDVAVLSRVHGAQQTGRANDLFRQDCRRICDELLTEIGEKSTAEHNLLYAFACYHAVYHNGDVVNSCLRLGRRNGMLSRAQRLHLWLLGAYGSVRPFMRRVYYKITRKG